MRKLIQTRHVLLMFVSCFCLAQTPDVFAQGTPRINALFPAGGQVGTTVDVSVQGAESSIVIAPAPTVASQSSDVFDQSVETKTTDRLAIVVIKQDPAR